jgi:nucleotide-binding universal stress UspA family protein
LRMATKNLLVPMDGSAAALRALEYAADRLRGSGGRLFVLNVQPGMPSSRVVSRAMIAEFHERQSGEALADARKLISRRRLRAEVITRVGEAAAEIVALAKSARCGEIVMGTRGLGRVSGLLLGSVAQKVIHLSSVPVVLVK